MVRKLSRRGRPLAFDPDLALDQAMRLFWERGFEATSLEDLELRTGLSRTSLYNSFGSKRELFAKALERYQRSLAERMLAPLEQGNEGIADLHAFIDAVIRQLDDPAAPAGCLMVNSMTEFGGADRGVVREAARYMARFRRAITSALERAAARAEIPGERIEAKANLLLGIVLGINVSARAGMRRSEIAALLDAAHMQLDAWLD